jgi:uncharacterized protein (TIGR02466 family)
MPRLRALFPTLVYQAPLHRAGAALNRRILRQCEQIQHDDTAGQRWSKRHYPGGYTSYNSVAHLHQASEHFAELERRVRRHVRLFAARLGLDLEGRALSMTDCWINIMPRGVVHGLHLHPHATISGTYYVRTPRGCAGLKFEDPRLDRFMAAPPRRSDCRAALQPWVTLPARAGTIVLFESWLRHEVPPNLTHPPRVSVSFNYHWR